MSANTRLDPIGLAEGFYLSRIVYNLHREKVFERLGQGATPDAIAGDLGFDADLLEALLDYVRQRTQILRRDRIGRYSMNPKYADYRRFGFHLDKFIGAYGPPLERLEESLRSPTLGADFVDSGVLASAFSGVEGGSAAVEAQIIRDWDIGSLLDIGCGPGALLVELASADAAFRGWGIDANAAMCAAAAERLRRAGLAASVRLIYGDARDLARHLDADERQKVTALHGGSVLNEFFRFGISEAVEFVGRLRNLFPDRLLFVSDYYGKLASPQRVGAPYAHTLLQDVAQAVSGQGIPPPDLTGWAEIYDGAAAEVVHAYEGESNGISWFVHVVRL